MRRRFRRVCGAGCATNQLLSQAVRTDRWIYIHYPANKNWDELYDLQADARQVQELLRSRL
jgi:hypothetical protein